MVITQTFGRFGRFFEALSRREAEEAPRQERSEPAKRVRENDAVSLEQFCQAYVAFALHRVN